MRKITTGDLLIISSWDIQDDKADILHKYKINQARVLSEQHVLPEEMDAFH